MDKSDLQSVLKTLKQHDLAWGQTGLALMEIEGRELWRGRASSFSAWINVIAKGLAIQPSILWRDLGAVRFYGSLGKEFDGLPLPPLSLVEQQTTAENLELIEKISRVAPRSTTRALLDGAVQGKLTRRSLRETWRVFQETTQAASRRGRLPRGVKRPPISNPPAVPEQYVANALTRISTARPNWIGCPNALSIRAYVRPPIRLQLPTISGGGAVAAPMYIVMVQEDAQSDIVFHSVEFLVDTRSNRINQAAFTEGAKYFEYLWVGLPLESSFATAKIEELMANVPRHVGVMRIDGQTVEVIRAPQRNEMSNCPSAVLAKQLLVYERR